MLLGARQFFEKRGAPTPPLPYDAEVEYLESTGTQWIDTGVVAVGEFDAEYTIGIATTLRTFIVGGARSATQHLNFGQYELSGSFILAYLGNYWTALNGIVANKTYTTTVHFASGSQSATVDGVVAASRQYEGVEAIDLNIFLFKRNFYGASDPIGPMIGRMYSFKMWRNGVLVRDMIPVRFTNEQSQSEGAMYDRVSGTLFGNAGTGAFPIGPDKS